MEPLHQPDEKKSGADQSFWPLLFIISVVALISVVSFGAGIVAERYVFGGPWLESGRLLGGLSSDDSAPSDSAFPRQAEIRDLIEDEYFFLPASPEAQATFWADVEQGAVDGMAAVAATPVASVDELRRELDYGAARGMTEILSDDYTSSWSRCGGNHCAKSLPESMRASEFGSNIQRGGSPSSHRLPAHRRLVPTCAPVT
jgi:hypothetical protein